MTTTQQEPSRAVQRAQERESTWANTPSPALKAKWKEEGKDTKGKPKGSRAVPVPQQPQAQQEPTVEQLQVLSTPIVEAQPLKPNAAGLYPPEGRLVVVEGDLPGYGPPIQIKVWYRVNNRYSVATRETMLDTNVLTAPIRADLERVSTALWKLTDEEKASEVGEKLKAEQAQLLERLREAIRLEQLDHYKKICTYVRRVSWNLDLETPDCNRPESWDGVFDEANDLARWIAGPGYIQALRQAQGPSFL